jgi:quercetin dioxygenase-like cupin family protein
MSEIGNGKAQAQNSGPSTFTGDQYRYDRWMESLGLPIYRGFYIEDPRELELGWWEERGCKTAFIQLKGQEGISEARVSEIPPGETLPPQKLALDEVVYVLEGRGMTTIWAQDGAPKRTVEWQPHSVFLLPRNQHHQLSNVQGNSRVRLLHYNYLPLAMTVVPDPDFFFNNPYQDPGAAGGQAEQFYSEAKSVPRSEENGGGFLWYGNVFPDMRAWDKLDSHKKRGAGGHRVFIQFPASELSCHMSVFPARTYKKAHRHGPGRVIIIPGGEGYSIMWEEGKEQVVVPWKEFSIFVPPNRWFHQHFNVGGSTARYLALHPPGQFHGYSDEKVRDLENDQIEYPKEAAWVRQKFGDELGKRGLTSLMPDEAYKDKNYAWSYEEAGA